MLVVDHTDPAWAARYLANDRENGAATYSRQIVEHHLDFWRAALAGRKAAVSTCPLMGPERPLSQDLLVQYLHRYPVAGDPLADVRRVRRGQQGARVLFVTAYRSLRDQIIADGGHAVWVPMTVDADTVRAAAGGGSKREGRLAYFGNLVHGKDARLPALQLAATAAGYSLDVFANGRAPSGRRLAQVDAWRELSRYPAGVGVGRCALEMYALGLPVLIYGRAMGGIVTSPEEFEVQLGTNLNGRVTTYDSDLAACLARLPRSYVPRDILHPSAALPAKDDPAIVRWLG